MPSKTEDLSRVHALCFFKKCLIRNTSLIPEKNKKRGLVLSEILRNDNFVLFDLFYDGDFSSS